MDKVKKLQAKRKKDLNQGKNLYSVAEKDLDRPSRQEAEQVAVLRALQVTLKKSSDKILSLRRDVENARRLHTSNVSVDVLQREKGEMQHKLIMMKGRVEDVKASLQVKQDLFK